MILCIDLPEGSYILPSLEPVKNGEDILTISYNCKKYLKSMENNCLFSWLCHSFYLSLLRYIQAFNNFPIADWAVSAYMGFKERQADIYFFENIEEVPVSPTNSCRVY